MAYQCERCCSTGLLSANLVKNNEHRNVRIDVSLCEHFDEETQINLDALQQTGLPVEIVSAKPKQEEFNAEHTAEENYDQTEE